MFVCSNIIKDKLHDVVIAHPLISGACTERQADYKPKISFIVCTKRNKQRFAVVNGQRKDNMEPGTVVDQDVTAPKRFNFYLNSHKAIQGKFLNHKNISKLHFKHTVYSHVSTNILVF